MEPVDLNQDHRGVRGQPVQASLGQRPLFDQNVAVTTAQHVEQAEHGGR